MSDATVDPLPSDVQAELQTAWHNAVERVGEGTDYDKALGFGINFRINVSKAFKAAWTTAKIYFTAEKIKLTGDLSPATLMGLASDAFTLVVATLDALREHMGGAEYVACVVLSRSEEGIPVGEFKKNLQDFIRLGGEQVLPWYIFISKPMIDELEQTLETDEKFEDLLEVLRNKDWIDEKGDTLRFKSRHLVLKDTA
ncbi:hypothetical protein SAMN05444166_2610 [Singulisphaera sp. GP187]|uniref:hypothetical protein n=1 Tax=Singulisphaera sp. GP187 TaxID=1882752 RepID=UPI00092AD8CC|nr:hypothetical protein [Singulisphaera sp. GP187]SIO12983.1 hypothetical protein SAMN05444166_2610 [Singulisphaera sp. GP187]